MTEPPRKRMVKPPTGGLEGGRGKPARLKTAKQRTPSQQAWLERQVNDPFAAKARALGYRSRAAFKISEIDERFHLFRKGVRVVDLGLAPGGWTQYAIQKGVTDIVGVDLLLPEADLTKAVVTKIWRQGATGRPQVDKLSGETLFDALADGLLDDARPVLDEAPRERPKLVAVA